MWWPGRPCDGWKLLFSPSRTTFLVGIHRSGGEATGSTSGVGTDSLSGGRNRRVSGVSRCMLCSCCFQKKKKKASEPFSGDRELRAEWLMQPQTLLLLLAHLLSKYLWVRWAQNVLKKMSGYLWIFCSYHLSKAARNCFQMAPERCLSFIKRKRATKLPQKELDVPDRMTQVSEQAFRHLKLNQTSITAALQGQDFICAARSQNGILPF